LKKKFEHVRGEISRKRRKLEDTGKQEERNRKGKERRGRGE
jgi:hypothetical protein